MATMTEVLEVAKWREGLAVGDEVYIITTGGGGRRTYRLGRVERRTPAQVVVQSVHNPKTSPRRFRLSDGCEPGSFRMYSIRPEAGSAKPAYGEPGYDPKAPA